MPTATPTRTPTPNAGESAVVLAAGDIASCSSAGDEATAALLAAQSGDVITLGDNAYESGTSTEFATCYGPSWGLVKNRTHPAPGNHEYNTSGASGYYNYFGAAAGSASKGYYSYDLGSWHLIALNSNCSEVGGCGAGSAQEQWLRADLAAHPTACTLAYWHHPLYSSGEHGNNTDVKPLYQALYDGNADLVLVGHDHDYERFGPQDANGNADPNRGIREFVVGTGGRSHYAVQTVRPNSEVRNNDTFGVLRLVLSPTGYSWEFLPVAGKTFTDSGTARCHDGSGPIAQVTGPAGAPYAAIARADTVAGVADRPRVFGSE
jgi:acid phosphatase type 7